MGASFYTLQWAERQWERLERGEKLAAHDQRALLLVYRHSWKQLSEKLQHLSFELTEAAGSAQEAYEGSPEIVYRNGTWRIREGRYKDEQDL